MTTTNDAQDYIEDLCRLHGDLLHELEGRHAFARLRTDSHITQIKNRATRNIVVIASVSGRTIGSQDGQALQRGISILFASRAVTSGSAAITVDDAVNKAEEIMLDFITKFRMDELNECLLNFDLESLSWEEIDGPWLENYYGWELFIPFKGYLPEYDEEIWNGVPATKLPDVIVFVARFRVGAAGAAMDEGDTTYTNPLLAGERFLLLADGKAIHQVTDNPSERYCTKELASDTITINGGVTENEVIEIYKIL